MLTLAEDWVRACGRRRCSSPKALPSPHIHEAEAIKDLGVTNISEFFFKFKDLIAKSRATVPFDNATAYLVSLNLANSLSNNSPSFP